ncbi:TATA box-binding protein-associated factor RNA polymerase I subunit A [Lycaon pictus]|uniref:TATA box-binding protein-associated factor RNA polymerase I subunit A n=3 Tax=Canis lupus TaxID=9612 RepID=A0A8C0SRZ5_CANLF|nr:TATA box-binding protein-associated factor RNA polymerase I subunit A [Canis lupus familiaris]XP_005640891.1 TATA box-binding protein-associated factor RNA polymerase I subunit A [Canis lupus familiaris]XP_013966640.1 TATA box-binding protein-associated factor RNA polymerase I subunit A [Canis lupus familiaris]XP_022271047.1 TATA box-binding protein-associated factor RNA polymerase I subunit A [Canis lupus familiaris]XP_022271048.1 TATA box-binding protein-associated factor RNA polymerase I |eukprot:XP_005640890.1 TATA box-binding protein-associated factor RNA polymerase I subunit A [Canis lupus familiaris]
MSDFSEELVRSKTEDEQEESCMFSGTGMSFPWLQKHIETVATGGKKEKDFAQTTSACLSFIQEALLKHQWQQAAEYMHSYFQILEDSDSYKRQAAPEIIWKLGSEILFYHPKSNMETFNTFADRMKNIGVMNYLKISLQHALYLLHHGMFEDANRNLSHAETWRYGEKSASQEVLINLIQAYKGLLQYYTWSKNKMELSRLDKEDYAYNTAFQNMLNHSGKMSVNLCTLIQTPGVWDPFVKSYVEMLEFYGDRDEAREVLTNYAYDEKFPSNPNAHIYLYNFLKREKAPREKLISVLKILYQIVPSHKLMLEFHRLLRKSDKEDHRKLALEVLFGVLDFAGCTKNITAWKYLAKYLRQTLMENHLAWVQEEWNSRKNWWPGFHFSFFWAKTNWKEDKALACEKALVAGILLGKGCRYFRYISKQDDQVIKKKIKRIKKSVKKYSIANPGL